MFGRRRKLAFNIPVCIEKDGDKYYAHCPALKGVHVDGETQEEALANVKLAIILYLKSLIKHGDPIPIQPILSEDLREHCEVQNHGRMVLQGYPQTELVQVPV